MNPSHVSDYTTSPVALPKVAVVVVNWNGKDDTLECLESLSGDRYPNKVVFLVDNGSADDSVNAVKASFPEAVVIETGTNLGFTGGNNAGIAAALETNPEYIYLLNNDTTCEPAALQELINAAQKSESHGLFVPVIQYYSEPTATWFGGSRLDLSNGTALHANEYIASRDDSLIDLDWATGCAMLIRADIVRRLRGFDDRFFLNWEDVDLSIRVRQMQAKIALVPAARIFHKVSRSIQSVGLRGLYYSVRNNLLLVRLHSGRHVWRASLAVIRRRIWECLRAFRHADPKASAQLAVTLRGIWDHFRGNYGARFS